MLGNLKSQGASTLSDADDVSSASSVSSALTESTQYSHGTLSRYGSSWSRNKKPIETTSCKKRVSKRKKKQRAIKSSLKQRCAETDSGQKNCIVSFADTISTDNGTLDLEGVEYDRKIPAFTEKGSLGRNNTEDIIDTGGTVDQYQKCFITDSKQECSNGSPRGLDERDQGETCFPAIISQMAKLATKRQ